MIIEICRVNRDDFKIGNFARMIRDYEAGIIDCQHCECDVCERERIKLNLPRCHGTTVPVEERCLACQNVANGVKVRDWSDMMNEIDTNLKKE